MLHGVDFLRHDVVEVFVGSVVEVLLSGWLESDVAQGRDGEVVGMFLIDCVDIDEGTEVLKRLLGVEVDGGQLCAAVVNYYQVVGARFEAHAR